MSEHKLVEQEALISQSQLLLDEAKIEKARKSFIHFCEYVIKDESTGNKIKLAELQRTWIYHIAFCKKYSLNALILAPMSSGKCVHPDTVFQTQDGDVYAKELVIGDSVLSYDGKSLVWNKIVNIETYEKPVIRIETEGGRDTIVSYDHPFLCNGEWVEAQDLRPNKDSLMLATGWDVENPLQEVSKAQAYLIGVVLGKIFNKGSRYLSESIPAMKIFAEDHELEFNEFFYKENPTYAETIIDGYKQILLPDVDMVLGKLFLHMKPTVESFVAGIFDSAGRYDAKNKVIQFFCDTKVDCLLINRFLNRIGFDGKIKRRIQDKIKKYYVELDKEQNDAFFLLDIAAIRNGKMRSKAKNSTNSTIFNDKVVSVKCVGTQLVYGVEVEDTHTHVTDGFISHNTQIISVGLPLYLLGRNPNTRIKLVCLSDDSAKERVSSIRGYIEEDEDYSKVFPGIKPGDKKEWTRHKLVVDRQTYAKDTSVDAKGIVASAIGGRADVLIVDDIFDQRTAVSQPATREQYLSTYTQVWLSRVEPNGRVVCICTRWHEQDLAGYVMANPRMMDSYGILIQRVADDFSGINCEVHIPDKLTDYYRKENPLVYTTVNN